MSVVSIKDSDIEQAAAMEDVVQAAQYLRDIAGVTTGDLASHLLNGKEWSSLDMRGRRKLLQEWLRTEFIYERLRASFEP